MKTGVKIVIIVALALFWGWASSHTQVSLAAERLTLTAAKVKKAPTSLTDSIWEKAKAVNISLEGKEIFEDMEVVVKTKSVYTKDSIYFLFNWKDATKSTLKGSWKYDGQKWSRIKSNEDRLALLFEITRIEGYAKDGCSATCHNPIDEDAEIQMATPKSTQTGDLWHWKAARSDPYNYADDTWMGAPGKKTGRKSDAGRGGDKKNITEDKSKPAFMQDPNKKPSAPGFILASEAVPITDYSIFKAGDVLTYRMPKKPSGSRADIKAKSKYENGAWTLMLSRKLKTGHSDDVTFRTKKKYYFSMAVFDDSGDLDSYDSEVIVLKFK